MTRSLNFGVLLVHEVPYFIQLRTCGCKHETILKKRSGCPWRSWKCNPWLFCPWHVRCISLLCVTIVVFMHRRRILSTFRVSSWFLTSFVMGGGGSSPSRAIKFMHLSGTSRVIKFLNAPAPPLPTVWALKPLSWSLVHKTTYDISITWASGRGFGPGNLEFLCPQKALAYRLAAISQGPKNSWYPGPNPLSLALVMDMHVSKTLCTGLYKS